jgi:RNA polymerase sigma-70 factor (ECF subfamily)
MIVGATAPAGGGYDAPAMAQPGDQEVGRLVGLLSSGDGGVVPTLLERYLADLHAYLDRHAGAELQARETPADLVQSVCREVLEGLQRGTFEFRGEAQFRQWLYQAALHKIQMKARYFAASRREAEREQRLDDMANSRGEHPLGISHTPSQSAAEREERRRFLAALQRLPEEQRQVVEWAHLEGLAHKEIAERLGISEANSRMILSRALAKLARLALQRE